MSDRGYLPFHAGVIAKALAGAITAVIFAGIAMQLVGVAMLAVPNLSFDASNPSILNPAFYIALVIIGIGVGITLTGCRRAIKLAKRADEALGSLSGSGFLAGLQGAARAPAGAPNVIRPALVKKEEGGPVPIKQASQPALISSPKIAEKEMLVSSGPADMDSVMAALNQISERYNKPDVRSKFDGWVNNLVMSFPDINKSFVFKINGSEGIEMVEGSDENATIQVSMASDMFVKLLSKQINAIKAYSSGALKVKGEMKNLLKLRKLMF
jgi:putative sterol carrier protein